VVPSSGLDVDDRHVAEAHERPRARDTVEVAGKKDLPLSELAVDVAAPATDTSADQQCT
jgi:hypothetical protein